MALYANCLKLLPKSSWTVINRNIKMSAQLRAEKVLDELKTKNPYFEKYATKIAALQKTDPEELQSRLEEIEKNKKPKKIVVDEKPR